MNAEIETIIRDTTESLLTHMVKTGNAETEIYPKTEKILYSYHDILYLAKKIGTCEYSDAQKVVNIIDTCLERLKDDPNFDLVQLKYFDKLTDEKIAEMKFCDPSTVRRKRKKIVKRLGNLLFPGTLFRF